MIHHRREIHLVGQVLGGLESLRDSVYSIAFEPAIPAGETALDMVVELPMRG